MDRIDDILFELMNMYRNQAKLRAKALRYSQCISAPIGCGEIANSFRDELSKREYLISGLCQKCQDQIFKESSTF